MSTAQQYEFVTVDDYLAGELLSDIKYEYVDGRVYAMAGGTNIHSKISSRALISLGQQLAGSPCEAFNSDTKIRIQRNQRNYFYYPDVSVVCESNPDDDTFQEQPVVVVEVVSESTRRIDEGEKRDNYLSLPSLSAYVLLEQNRPAARVYLRGEDGEFTETVFRDVTDVIPLAAIEAELRLADIYAGIQFPARES